VSGLVVFTWYCSAHFRAFQTTKKKRAKMAALKRGNDPRPRPRPRPPRPPRRRPQRRRKRRARNQRRVTEMEEGIPKGLFASVISTLENMTIRRQIEYSLILTDGKV